MGNWASRVLLLRIGFGGPPILWSHAPGVVLSSSKFHPKQI